MYYLEWLYWKVKESPGKKACLEKHTAYYSRYYLNICWESFVLSCFVRDSKVPLKLFPFFIWKDLEYRFKISISKADRSIRTRKCMGTHLPKMWAIWQRLNFHILRVLCCHWPSYILEFSADGNIHKDLKFGIIYKRQKVHILLFLLSIKC